MSKDVEVNSNRFRREHVEIEELETQLLKAICERQQTPAQIGRLFEALYERAVAHFHDEEFGAIYDATQDDSALSKRCEELCEDHRRLKDQLDRLMAIVEQASCTTQWWDDLEKQFHPFWRELNKHEALEQTLLDDIEKATSLRKK